MRDGPTAAPDAADGGAGRRVGSGLHRLDPALLGFTARIDGERRFLFEADAKAPPVIVQDPLLIWAIAALPETFDEAEAKRVWSSTAEGAERAGELWNFLIEQDFAIPAESPRRSSERGETWARYGWQEAFAFQEATRGYPFVNMTGPDGFREDRGRMKRYRAESAPPPVHARPPAAPGGGTEIAMTDWASRVADSGSGGFTERDLDPADDLDALAFILDYSAGWRGKIDLGDQGEVLLKSVPSGGARHPAEILVAIFEGFDGAPAGAYRYDVERHALALIEPGDHTATCRAATFDLFDKYDRPPVAMLLFTARMERAMWRYRDPRSARAPFVDIGHVLMAVRTATKATGLSHYTYQKFREPPLCALFGLDPVAEPPIYVGALV